MAKDKSVSTVVVKRRSREELAELIMALTYGELVGVGEQIAQAQGRNAAAAEEVAAMLHTWAKSALE